MAEEYKQTNFRISDAARDFLEQKGNGNRTKGLMKLLEEAGFRATGTGEDNSQDDDRAVIRRESDFQKKEYRYLLIKNQNLITSLSIPFGVQNKTVAEYGEAFFYERFVIGGLLSLPQYAKFKKDIDTIVDLDTGKVVFEKRMAEELIGAIGTLLDISRALLRNMEESLKTNKKIDRELLPKIKNEAEKLIKDTNLSDFLKARKLGFLKDIDLIMLSFGSAEFNPEIKQIVIATWKTKIDSLQKALVEIEKNKSIDEE